MLDVMSVQELAYEATLQMTGQTDFGISMEQAMTGAKAIPPGGLRVDVPVQGDITGPKLTGKLVAIDYLVLDSPVSSRLHVHGVITTHDGHRIALFSDGCANMQPGTPIGDLRENITLHTASEKYAWVNGRQFWSTGQVDLSGGKVSLKTYLA
jgi:hypothetical protein